MLDRTRFIGLDVQATTIAIAVAEEGRDEPLCLPKTPSWRLEGRSGPS